MYARIIQVSLRPGAAAEATAHFRDTVGPALKQQDGFLNSRFLVDAEHDRCLMVTLWITAEARQSAETNGFLQAVLAAMKTYFVSQPTIDYYEVTVQA